MCCGFKSRNQHLENWDKVTNQPPLLDPLEEGASCIGYGLFLKVKFLLILRQVDNNSHSSTTMFPVKMYELNHYNKGVNLKSCFMYANTFNKGRRLYYFLIIIFIKKLKKINKQKNKGRRLPKHVFLESLTTLNLNSTNEEITRIKKWETPTKLQGKHKRKH